MPSVRKSFIHHRVGLPSITFVLEKLEWTEEARREFRFHPVYSRTPGIRIVTVDGYPRLLVQQPTGVYSDHDIPPPTPRLAPIKLRNDNAIPSLSLSNSDGDEDEELDDEYSLDEYSSGEEWEDDSEEEDENQVEGHAAERNHNDVEATNGEATPAARANDAIAVAQPGEENETP